MAQQQKAAFLLSGVLLACATACSDSIMSRTWHPEDLYDGPGETRVWPLVDRAVEVRFFPHGHLTFMSRHWMLNDGRIGGDGVVRDGPISDVHGLTGDPLPPNASMPEPQRTSLDEAIRELPPSEDDAKDGDAFVVSWAVPNGRITRTYDRANLPMPVQRLCRLLKVPPTWILRN